MNRFVCPFCRRHLEADDDRVGAHVVCPGCKARIDVPPAGAPEPPLVEVPPGDLPHPPPPTRGVFFVRLFVGFLLLSLPLGLAAALGSVWLAVAMLVIGSVVTVSGTIWLIIEAFGVGVVQGMLVLFVPGYPLVFLLFNWEEGNRPFFVILTGMVVTSLAGAVLAWIGALGTG